MLNEKDAIRVEVVSYGRSERNNKLRTQKVYIYKCQCGDEIRSSKSHLKKHSGNCVRCAQWNDPYKAIHNELIKNANRRNIPTSITYDEFLTFTTITKCHYCCSKIEWHAHTVRADDGNQIAGSRSYKLDRMNNDLGYSVVNCVVCCFKCNRAKGDTYTYEEWRGMTSYFRNGVCGL